MTPRSARRIGVSGTIVLVALYLVHQDFWNWDSTERLLGVPVGMAFHIGYCLAASLVLTWVSRGLEDGRR